MLLGRSTARSATPGPQTPQRSEVQGRGTVLRAVWYCVRLLSYEDVVYALQYLLRTPVLMISLPATHTPVLTRAICYAHRSPRARRFHRLSARTGARAQGSFLLQRSQ
eukprot:935030-Rhodomonas_salina.1